MVAAVAKLGIVFGAAAALAVAVLPLRRRWRDLARAAVGQAAHRRLMEPHSILMLAATGVVVAFVPIVLIATWLARRGVLANSQPGLAFHTWAPPIAATCSIGAAAIHVVVVPEHADEFPPAGVFFAALAAFQLVWAVAWLRRQSNWLAVVGLTVNLLTIAIWVWSRTIGFPLGAEPGSVEPVGYRDVLATVLEVVLAVVLIATLSEGRVQRIRELRLTAQDAFVATGLAMSAVVIFSTVAVLVGEGH